MTEFRYHLLAILGALIMAGYSIIGTVGGGQTRLYQSALLSIGLVVAVSLAFHLGTQWEARKTGSHRDS